jgi:nicotinate-nucleotide adenylyltransferase
MTPPRIGLLGGTFDPIHIGHLAIAEEARVALQLERVLFIPAGHQPFKGGRHGATPEQRLAMVQLACASNPAFAASPIEIMRPGPSYTATTLEQLAAQHPGLFHFILGIDALAELHRWRSAARIVELARIVGIARPGHTPNLDPVRAALPLLNQRLDLIEGPRLELSSSDLRQRIADGQPIRYLTPDPVVEYIEAQRLYRAR